MTPCCTYSKEGSLVKNACTRSIGSSLELCAFGRDLGGDVRWRSLLGVAGSDGSAAVPGSSSRAEDGGGFALSVFFVFFSSSCLRASTRNSLDIFSPVRDGMSSLESAAVSSSSAA